MSTRNVRQLLVFFGSIWVLAWNVSVSDGQFPPPPGPPIRQIPQMYRPQPKLRLPPPLFVRFGGPIGMRVSVYRGTAKESTLIAPFTVALRPGYVYRMEITDIPGYETLILHPTVEVRGTLIGNGKFKPRDFPALVQFTKDDVDAIVSGKLVTRVVTLEKQSQAIPVASNPKLPLQFNAEPNTDPIKLAEEYGTPFVIVRLGQRTLSQSELTAGGIPGTVLLPGEKSGPLPRIPPYLPWFCQQLHDPLMNPRNPWEDVCIPDGGDFGTRAGFGIEGELKGLDPADTVAEYVDNSGRKRIVASNRVCICVPRFLSIRGETQLFKNLAYMGPKNVNTLKGQNVMATKIPVVAQYQNVALKSIKNKTRPSVVRTNHATHAFGQVDGLNLVASVKGLKGVSSASLPPKDSEPPERPLKLIKWPDKYGAAIGDIVTFSLKFVNEGGRPIQNVIVSDSLNPRFEYVPGTQKTDRAALFTTQNNEVGSQVLSWQFTDPLPPGQSGLITFEVRVR